MRRILKSILLLALLFGLGSAYAQNSNNALLYSNQATLFGEQGSATDPVSIVMPGTAFKSGFGSFIDNPASMAMHRNSFGEFGISYRSVDEDAIYLGERRTLDDTQSGVSNLGFLYSIPTVRGSFVFGGGYTQHSIYNRSLGFRARNVNSTITDQFKTDGSPYQEVAFSTYATDFGDDFGDWDESIFRVGFDNYGDFFGITQQGEIFQRGYSGEYSLFFATEFQENLMIGASLGLLSGRYNYNRIFQEIDELNDYSSTIIETDQGGTDVDNLTLDDRLESRFAGFRARVGVLYRLSDHVTLGGSYTLPTIIEIDETYDVTIRNVMDNGDEFRESELYEFAYSVRYPSRTALGLGLVNLGSFSASLSAEYVDYSATTVDFGDSEFFDDERIENDFIESEFRSVWSFRSGLAYDVSPDVTLRAGYGYLPSRFLNGNDDRSTYSFGTGISLTNTIRLEVAAQYTRWDEVSAVYDYARYDYSQLPENLPNINFESESANRSVDRWQLLGSLKINL